MKGQNSKRVVNEKKHKKIDCYNSQDRLANKCYKVMTMEVGNHLKTKIENNIAIMVNPNINMK